MTHHEAQVIATSYREQAALVMFKGPEGMRLSRMFAMEDHSAVWQRVADTLKQEAPNVPQ